MGEWQIEELLKINKGYECKVIYNADETGMFFRLLPNTTPNLKEESFNGRKNYIDRKMVVSLQSNKNKKLPPLIAGNSESNLHFKHVKKFPTIHVVNRKRMDCIDHLYQLLTDNRCQNEVLKQNNFTFHG